MHLVNVYNVQLLTKHHVKIDESLLIFEDVLFYLKYILIKLKPAPKAIRNGLQCC